MKAMTWLMRKSPSEEREIGQKGCLLQSLHFCPDAGPKGELQGWRCGAWGANFGMNASPHVPPSSIHSNYCKIITISVIKKISTVLISILVSLPWLPFQT